MTKQQEKWLAQGRELPPIPRRGRNQKPAVTAKQTAKPAVDPMAAKKAELARVRAEVAATNARIAELEQKAAAEKAAETAKAGTTPFATEKKPQAFKSNHRIPQWSKTNPFS